MKKILIIATLLQAIITMSCSNEKEVAHLQSPDGTYQVIVVHRYSGATVQDTYYLYLSYKYWPFPVSLGMSTWVPDLRICWATDTNLKIYNLPPNQYGIEESCYSVKIDLLEHECPESIRSTCPPLPDVE